VRRLEGDERCAHDSASGIDQTPLDDPEKVWRCESCGAFFHSVADKDGISHVLLELDPTAPAPESEHRCPLTTQQSQPCES
jgi:hypothetical protein